jgi:hypothetical protein
MHDIPAQQTHFVAISVSAQPPLGTKPCQLSKKIHFPLSWFEAPLVIDIDVNHEPIQVDANVNISLCPCSSISLANLRRCDIGVVAASALGDPAFFWQRGQ